MHIEIDNERPIDGPIRQQDICGHRHIVEGAETGTGFAPRMMAAAGRVAGHARFERQPGGKHRSRGSELRAQGNAFGDFEADLPLDLARHPKLFAHSDKPFLKRRGGKEQREKSLAAAKAKTDEQRAAGAAALLKKEAKKRKRLAENFPGFDFPGYAGAAQGARRPDDDGAPTKKKKAADPEKKAAKKAKKAKK